MRWDRNTKLARGLASQVLYETVPTSGRIFLRLDRIVEAEATPDNEIAQSAHSSSHPSRQRHRNGRLHDIPAADRQLRCTICGFRGTDNFDLATLRR
jgi:hypothetical protein